jgi:hypothetical protein
LWFLLQPAPSLLEHHARHRTSHASLIAGIETHVRNLYAKLGVRTRSEAVTRAGALGLLAPPPCGMKAATPVPL